MYLVVAMLDVDAEGFPTMDHQGHLIKLGTRRTVETTAYQVDHQTVKTSTKVLKGYLLRHMYVIDVDKKVINKKRDPTHNNKLTLGFCSIGHYINQCPTNGDKEYDKHPRIKRTTGIPRSFLKVIDAPKDAVKSGTGGLMVTPKGDIVVAQADSSTWDQHMAKAATALGGDILDLYDSIPAPDYAQCPLCQGLMREATITPCCGASFCDECIRGHLLENDFRCFDCQQPIHQGLDGLVPNGEVRLWIDRYVRRCATTGAIQQGGDGGDNVAKNSHANDPNTLSKHNGSDE
jgi:hypothetical protein